jgi:hypothetical protein
MQDSIRPVAQLYGVNTALFGRALDGLDRQALLRRPDDCTNPLLWIAGHLASVRYSVCNLLGQPHEVPWGRTFFRGSTLDVSTLPEIDGIRRSWDEISAVLAQRLEEATPEQLALPSPRTFPIEDTSVRGAITFLSWHEGYHMGQMSLLRKWLGQPGLAG